jgi:hypothetical protein
MIKWIKRIYEEINDRIADDFSIDRIVNIKKNEDSYRLLAAKQIARMLNKNEVAYYEIVGYEKGEGGAPIMQPISLKEFPKEIRKKYPDPMVYKYGCLEGEFDVYVYRICIVNEDGIKHDLSWDEIKMRCKEANLKTPPEIFRTYITSFPDGPIDNTSNIIREKVEYYTNEFSESDLIDSSHFLEGVCVRIEHPNGKTKVWKNKSYNFKIGESLAKASDFYTDIEEEESY